MTEQTEVYEQLEIVLLKQKPKNSTSSVILHSRHVYAETTPYVKYVSHTL